MVFVPLLVTTFCCICASTGVCAAGAGRPSRSPLGTGAGQELPISEPSSAVAPAPSQGPPGEPPDNELQHTLESLKAEIEVHLEEPYFHYLVEHNPTVQRKLVDLLRTYSIVFGRKFGVPPTDITSLNILYSAQQGTLLRRLQSPKTCRLLATYIEIYVGDMGEDLLIWGGERRRGKLNFDDVLRLLRQVTYAGQLRGYLNEPAGRLVFYVFYLTLLRRMARQGREGELRNFDRSMIEKIKSGHLASDLNNPVWRHYIVKRLVRSDSVLRRTSLSGLPLEEAPTTSTAYAAPCTSGAPATSPPDDARPKGTMRRDGACN